MSGIINDIPIGNKTARRYVVYAGRALYEPDTEKENTPSSPATTRAFNSRHNVFHEQVYNVPDCALY